MRRDLGLEHVEDVRVIDRRIDQVNTGIIAMTKQRDTTLIRIYGIGWIAAAVIIAETVDVRRFPTKPSLRPLHRDGTYRCVVGRQQQASAVPVGEPSVELGDPRRCDHPDPQPDSRTPVLRPQDRRGPQQAKTRYER
jgi:hypothetical protein